MPRYRASLTAIIWEDAVVEVDAENEDAADEAVQRAISSGTVDWEFGGTKEIITDWIEEIEPRD